MEMKFFLRFRFRTQLLESEKINSGLLPPRVLTSQCNKWTIEADELNLRRLDINKRWTLHLLVAMSDFSLFIGVGR